MAVLIAGTCSCCSGGLDSLLGGSVDWGLSSPSATEQLIDGLPAAKAFRHREVMLIQAIMEKYGQQMGGVTTDSMVKEFLGAGPEGGGGKIGSGEGSYSNRGALDIDTQPMMEEVGLVNNFIFYR